MSTALQLKPLRRAHYRRTSTDEQTASQTIKNQDRALRRRYTPEYETGEATFVGDYQDDGVSGTVPFHFRPAGGQLADACRRGEVDVICVYRVDRLSRDSAILTDIAKFATGCGVRIESLNENVDLTTSSGVFTFTLYGAVAQLERDTIRDRTVAGRDRAIADGKFINGAIPFGYDVVDKRLVPSTRIVEELGCTECELVVEIYTRVAGGESVLSVMRWLRSLGVPSYKRYTNKIEVYPRWQHSRLRDMIMSTTYYGVRTLKLNKHGPSGAPKEPAPVQQIVPALVSRDLWNRANEAMSKHFSNFNTGTREGYYVYLLSGVLKCGHCGFNMIGNYQKPRKGHGVNPRTYYCCSRAKGRTNARRTGEVCSMPVYSLGAQLEEQILLKIDALVEDPSQTIDELRAKAIDQNGLVERQESRLAALRQQVAAYDRGKESLRTQLMRGTLDNDEFEKSVRQNAEESASIRAEIEAVQAQEIIAETIEQQMRSVQHTLDVLHAGWFKARASNDRPALREMVQGCVQEVRLFKDGRKGIVRLCFVDVSTDSIQTCNYLEIGRYDFMIG